MFVVQKTARAERPKESKMKDIKQYEDAIKNQVKSLKDEGINGTMFWAYRNSKDAECEDLNFYETIWERDIGYIVETCRKEGIKQITISSTFSGMPEVLWEFVKLGCAVEGMKIIPEKYKEHNWVTGEEYRRQIPAVIVKIN